jgi:uncharacterized membrane protein
VQRETESVTIEDEVEHKLGPILSNLPKVQREQILSAAITVVKTEAFSGPLPHPKHLQAYDMILPGGADRIFKMTESVIDSNIAANTRAQEFDQNYRLIGMACGFVALMVLIGASVCAGLHDYLGLAALLMGATAIGSIGIFVNAHWKK